jgi:LPS-assembly protein
VQSIRWLSLLAAMCLVPAANAQTTSSAADGELLVPGLKLAPGLITAPPPTADQQRTFLEADQIDGETDSSTRLRGNGEWRRGGTVLKGDLIDYRQVEDEIEATGRVRLLRDGNLVTGPSLKLNLSTGEGTFDQPKFYLGTNGASGTARTMQFRSNRRVRLEDTIYTGCDCATPAWELRAKRVDLDYEKGEGVGYNGVIYFKDVPILASPIMSFPINDDRKSGFLVPTFGINSKNGIDSMVPYYFNIAPNRDATLYTRLMSKRGLQLAGDFRYLEPNYRGELRGEYLANDNRFGSDRYFFSSKHSQDLGNGFGLNWNYNRASDDQYFRDFSATALGQASAVTLEQSATVTWGSEYWSGYARTLGYQTLQDPKSPIAPPYDRRQLHLEGARYDWGGFDLRMESDVSRFTHPSNVDGSRAYAYPTISYPMVRPGGFIIPKVGVHMTQYQVDSFSGNQSFGQSRVVPIMSVDSGLVFERETTVFKAPVTQTLEPRLFYLRVPYRNQDRLPLFDTDLADFNFAQVFSENLFSGWDRIADANQLTAALTSRWLDPKSGVERARVMAAQRVYFSDQRVSFPGQEARTDGRSDFLFSVYGALTQSLSAEATVQYNTQIDRLARTIVTTRWQPARLSTVAVSVRQQRQAVSRLAQEQVDVAFQWPLSRQWFGVGRVDYSFQDNRIIEMLAGLEYKSDCCWALRVVGQRYAVAKDEATTALFLQLELTGLSRIGSSPFEALRRGVPGYQTINPSAPAGSVFERYE